MSPTLNPKLELELMVPRKAPRTIPRVVLSTAGALSFNRPFLEMHGIDPQTVHCALVHRAKGAEGKILYIEFLGKEHDAGYTANYTNAEYNESSGLVFQMKAAIASIGAYKKVKRFYDAQKIRMGKRTLFTIDFDNPVFEGNLRDL